MHLETVMQLGLGFQFKECILQTVKLMNHYYLKAHLCIVHYNLGINSIKIYIFLILHSLP